MERREAARYAFEYPEREPDERRSAASTVPGRPFRGSFQTFWIPRLRPFAVAALACLLYQVAAPWSYVEAQPPGGRPAVPTPGVADRADEAVSRARDALAELREAAEVETLAAAAAIGQAADAAEAAFQPLEEIDREILDGYRKVDEHVRDAGLPATVRSRNDAAEKAYRDAFQELRQAVRETIRLAREQQREAERGNAAAAAERRDEVRASAAAADERLAAMVARPEPAPLDPHNLPHRVARPTEREPRLTPEDFDGLYGDVAGSPDEARGGTKVLGFDVKATAPGPEDLAETVEVRFTPQITALAEELATPVAIFNYVRENVAFTPVFGSVQGARGCLETRICNAFDSSSLLVALLRAAGFPARYAIGTVEAPIAAVAGLMGGTPGTGAFDPGAALNFLASGGTPTVGVTGGGARFEHVWVEAFLDYAPSRGATAGGEGDAWVPLDPVFKRFDFPRGLDLTGLTIDPEPFVDSILENASVDEDAGSVVDLSFAALEAKQLELEAEVEALLAADPPASPRDVVGGRVVADVPLEVLPASLPYRVLARAGSFSEVPEELRHRLRLEVFSAGAFAFTPDLTWSASLPELAGRRITLSYAPASAADEATLLSFIPDGASSVDELPTSLPGYLIEVRPELKVEGEVKAQGAAVPLGLRGRWRLAFEGPVSIGGPVDNLVTAGTYNALVLHLSSGVEDGALRRQAVEEVRQRLLSGNVAGLGRDDVIGEFLHAAGRYYWGQNELVASFARHLEEVVSARLPSEGIFTFDLKVASFFGAPLEVEPGALVTDVDTSVVAVAALDGKREKTIAYVAETGIAGSASESRIWDQLLNETPTGQGVTTIAYLEEAARRSIPVHQLSADNAAAVLPSLDLSAAVKRDIENAVAAGKVVVVPQREFVKDGFTGVGYLVLDPETGAGAYLISGGIAGGSFLLSILLFLLALLLIFLAVFAPELALLAFLAGLAVAALSAFNDFLGFNNIPGLAPELRDAAPALFAALFAISAIIAIAGFFAGVSAGAILVAVIATTIVFLAGSFYYPFIARLFSRILNAFRNLPLTRRSAFRWREPYTSVSWATHSFAGRV